MDHVYLSGNRTEIVHGILCRVKAAAQPVRIGHASGSDTKTILQKVHANIFASAANERSIDAKLAQVRNRRFAKRVIRQRADQITVMTEPCHSRGDVYPVPEKSNSNGSLEPRKHIPVLEDASSLRHMRQSS